ncbi:hypothetical protein ABL78_5065 [Leptomonas seymouri]|uniref:Uncharacterized protein n=1 Tax=Leptomonas seymouri TaxID=5684 RepID=A0A0N1IK58_LEPSE|nr:hypothetical protein ABL78_5065 [Leptomonas seymouri]|eukprot:KPI85884.1 hypothetical protein ABL78_5065 [Leptomonas seymouri]
MASLPVIHLKATSPQNATITDDPYETTATLYTFLRSLPSVAEREMAFQPFIESLHAAPSSGRSALMRKPNHRLVQLLETVAVDGVFRYPPRIIPGLTRHSGQWVRRLGYDDGGIRYSTPSKEQQSIYGVSGPAGKVGASSPSSVTPTPSMPQVIRAADLQQFANPYSAYEAQHGQQAGRATEEHDGAENVAEQRKDEGEEHLQYSGSTQAPEELPGEHAVQPYRSYLSAEVSALTPTESDAREHESSGKSENPGEMRDRPNFHSASFTDGVHPVLELIARQVEQSTSQSRDEGSAQQSQQPASPSPPSASLDERIRHKIFRITSRLDEAAEEVSAAMREKEAAEQMWSPYYSRLKTSMSFVEELQQRLGSAISLYQLQRYERETLQQARVAVQMEALSLKLVLRDVSSLLTDAVEMSDPALGQSIEDEELIERLREVLHPSEDAAADA